MNERALRDALLDAIDEPGAITKSTLRNILIKHPESDSREFQESVLSFINERGEYVQAARNSRGEDIYADYHRWQGHMEARRQLAQALGYTVPYEPGEKTERKGA